MINQHNKQHPKPIHKPIHKPVETLQGTYSNLNLFPFKKTTHKTQKTNFINQTQSSKSFMPFPQDHFKKNLTTTLQSELSKNNLNKQNKENLGSLDTAHEDILPSYMRFTKNVNSRSDFKFHF